MEWKDLAHFMYGRGFWYARVLDAIDNLSETQLLWTPRDGDLPMLWHVGHIAQREALHIGCFVAGSRYDELVPERFGVFVDWEPVERIREGIGSVSDVLRWAQETRERCHGVIDALSDADLDRPSFDESDPHLTVAHWLVITPVHTGVHYGKIQALRAQIEGVHDPAC